MTGFGDRLKTARGDETQASFAKRLGISQVAYSRYESGQREPSLDCLYQIGLLTGVSADWLLGLTNSHRNGRGTPTAHPPPTTVNLDELRATATQLAEESVALSMTIKKLKKML